jgi:predicted nuclease of predicted toxin-antitoxin system
MKFLADMGISQSTVQALRNVGHDAVHLREQGLQRLIDVAILDKARQEKRIVLTFDLDFGELLAVGLHDSPSVVIFRLHNATPASVQPKLMEVLEKEGKELEQGAIVIVQDTRYRLRRLPIKGVKNPP